MRVEMYSPLYSIGRYTMIKWAITLIGCLGLIGSFFLFAGGEYAVGLSGLIGSFLLFAIVKVIELLEDIREALRSQNLQSNHKPFSQR